MSRYLNRLNQSDGHIASEFLGTPSMFGASSVDVRKGKFCKKGKSKKCPDITLESIEKAKKEYKGNTKKYIPDDEFGYIVEEYNYKGKQVAVYPYEPEKEVKLRNGAKVKKDEYHGSAHEFLMGR